MSLKTLPEKFLYSRLPPGVAEEDVRSIIEALTGGFQDRLEDLRTFADKYSHLLDPNTILPETELNVLTVTYQGRGFDGVLKRNIDSAILDQIQTVPKNEVKEGIEYLVIGGSGVTYGTTLYVSGKTFVGTSSTSSYTPKSGRERVYRKEELYDLLFAVLELGETEILGVNIATDSLRLVDANVLRNLAETIGATLYAKTTPEQKRIIAGHFPRLKVKGTLRSYELLGKLLGFDNAKLTPLWGRVSPHNPSDIGSSENDVDFSGLPHFEPSQNISTNYDPRVTDDGPFHSWVSGTIDNDRTATNFYTEVVNTHNPFVSVSAGITEDIKHPAVGVYRLSGGGAHQKAFVIPEGSGLKFEAIAEGESFNGLPIQFSEVIVNVDGKQISHRKIEITWKLSAIKYRTSYYNLSLTIDFEKFRKIYGELPVAPNTDLKADPEFLDGDTGGAAAPYRPYTWVDTSDPMDTEPIQADGTEKQANIEKLFDLGVQASHYFEELRAASRFPRQVSFGFSFDDDVIYAPHVKASLLFTTAGTTSYSSDLPATIPEKTALAGVAAKTSSVLIMVRSTKLHTFKAVLPNIPVIPGSVSLESGGTDNQLGQFTASGNVLSGRINYVTGEVEVTYVPTFHKLTANIAYSYYKLFTAENHRSSSNDVINYRNSEGNISGAIDFTEETYSFSSTSSFGVEVYAIWGADNLEVIRTEPSEDNKSADNITALPRPEDEAFTLVGSETEDLEEKSWMHGLLQLADESPYKRGLVLGGELLDKDIYNGEGNPLADVSGAMTVIDHRGVEFDIVGYDAHSLGVRAPIKPIRISFVEREHDEGYHPGMPALAVDDSHNVYHVGLVQGVLVADPVKFLSKAHYEKLSLWVPFNNHPEDRIVLKDHSSYNSLIDISGIFPDYRSWDETRGWYLNLKKVGVESTVKISGYRHLSTDVTLSFWMKVSQAAEAASSILTYGPLKIELGGGNSPSVSFMWNKGTAAVPVWHSITAAEASDEFLHVWIRKTGSKIEVNFNDAGVVQATDSLFLGFTLDDTELTVRSGDNIGWGIHDLRIWGAAKSNLEIESISNPNPTKTIVAYTPTYFKTAGRRTRWALKVLASGFVVPTEYPDFPRSKFFSKTGVSRDISVVRTTRLNGQSLPGGVVITGKDPDFHSLKGPNSEGARNLIIRSIEFVTYRKPNPRILLVQDLGVGDYDNYADGRIVMTLCGYPTFTVADHLGIEGSVDIETVDFNNYDVVVVPSTNGWFRQSQLDLLNSRKNDLYAYINQGGGMVVMNHTGLTNAYQFLPFVTAVTASQAESNFTVTDYAVDKFGIVADDVNGNTSQSYFSAYAGMTVLEEDASDRVITAAARLSTIADGGFTSASTLTFGAKETYDSGTTRSRINSSLARISRYDKGYYQGEDRFKLTGLTGNNALPSVHLLGLRYSPVLGSGLAILSAQDGVGPTNSCPAPDGHNPQRRFIFEVGSVPPAIPGPPGISAHPSTRSVQVLWTAVPTATSYRVKRSLSADGPFSAITVTSSSTGYTDTAVTPGVAHYYVVTAINSGGESVDSNVASATPLALPAAPSGLVLTPIGQTSVKIDFVDNSINEDLFRVEKSLDGIEYDLLTNLSAGVTTYTDESLTSSTDYWYRVAAVNSVGISSFIQGKVTTGGGLVAGSLFNLLTQVKTEVNFGRSGPAVLGLKNDDHWEIAFKHLVTPLANQTLIKSDKTWSSSYWAFGPSGGTEYWLGLPHYQQTERILAEGIYASEDISSLIPTDWYIVFRDLPAGTYDLVLYGHGPHPKDNAVFTLSVNEVEVGTKSTTADETFNTNYPRFVEGKNYVRFTGFAVGAGHEVKVAVARGASGVSIINALQLQRLS